jgi:hypothetical protein
MTLFDYFAKPATPAANSSVGTIMVKILEKYPDMNFEAARAQANAIMDKAARRFNYKMPRVYSREELGKRRESLRTASNRLPPRCKSRVGRLTVAFLRVLWTGKPSETGISQPRGLRTRKTGSVRFRIFEGEVNASLRPRQRCEGVGSRK